ncbi:hypothetical protein WJX77_004196 [Trebouxia sp. C0004]
MKPVTPRHLAARQANLETARYLVCNGADRNVQEVQEEALGSWDWTLLCYAAWHDKIQMVELLLSHGASADVKDSKACQQGILLHWGNAHSFGGMHKLHTVD